MPKKLERALSPTFVRNAPPGLHCDGGGLYLQVKPTKDGGGISRSWIFRFRPTGSKYCRDMGLGPLSTVGLAEARDIARALRVKRLDGIDPIEARRAARATVPAKLMTFDEASLAYISAHESGWRNAKHHGQWRVTLKTYASPIIGTLPVRAVDTAAVKRVLEPIWREKPDTANRLRGRIELVLDWAKALDLRDGENPARWRGHLDKVFPRLATVRKAKRERQGRTGHHAALPYAELGAFMAELRQHTGAVARALEFTILTAARTGEVLGAVWPEIDLGAAVWTIRPRRTKSGREHRIPLSGPAIALLKAMAEIREGNYVFNGDVAGQPLSSTALLMALRRMRPGLTVHGFRSSFRDWCAEQTAFPREIAEAALGHVLADRTEAAYQRGDLLDKRRKLMAAWAAYADRVAPAAAVVFLRKRSA